MVPVTAANHPAVTFTSRRVTVASAGGLHVEGDLSVAGHCQPVTFDARLSELFKEWTLSS